MTADRVKNTGGEPLIEGFPARIHTLYAVILDHPDRRYGEEDREAAAALADAPQLKRLTDSIPKLIPAGERAEVDRILFSADHLKTMTEVQLGDQYASLPKGFVQAAAGASAAVWKQLHEPGRKASLRLLYATALHMLVKTAPASSRTTAAPAGDRDRLLQVRAAPQGDQAIHQAVTAYLSSHTLGSSSAGETRRLRIVDETIVAMGETPSARGRKVIDDYLAAQAVRRLHQQAIWTLTQLPYTDRHAARRSEGPTALVERLEEELAEAKPAAPVGR